MQREATQARPFAGNPRRVDLEDALRGKIPEAVLAEVLQVHAGEQLVTEIPRDGIRGEDFPTIRGREQPAQAVQPRRAIVTIGLRHDLANMEGHAHAGRWRDRPGFREELLLRRDGGTERPCGARKRGLEGIADDLVDDAVLLRDGGTQDGVVPFIDHGHGLRPAFPVRRASFQVGEEEGHASRGRISHGECGGASGPYSWPAPAHERTGGGSSGQAGRAA